MSEQQEPDEAQRRHEPGSGHDAPDHDDPVATEDPVAGPDQVEPDEETAGAVQPAQGPAESGPAGDSPVADAMRSLDSVADRPVEEHPEVYEQVHTVLRRSLDEGSGSSPS